jgi:DNA-binding CsgD family transcriptional regulator
MTDGYAALTEKEKETLRLIVRGHDAKSMARHLGLSVHTINERLRDARRKLSVSSSREAARLLHEHEGADPQSSADKQIGEAGDTQHMGQDGRPANGQGRSRVARIGTGVAIMTLALGLLALVALPQTGSAPSGAATVTADTAVATSARNWLALVDAFRWEDSWAGTTASFRKTNTTKVWADVSKEARVPLGAVRTRVLISQDSVPAPPAGIQVLKFKTSFANKPEAIEKLSLAKEEGEWRVVGYYIE